MSKSKIKLQPISVRSPLPEGSHIPSLPLPHQGLITKAPSNEETSHSGYTGITAIAATRNIGGAPTVKRRPNGAEDNKGNQARLAFPELPSYIEGKVRDVWRFLTERVAFHSQGNSTKAFVRATRREIAKGASIGSLDTVDRSLARLQGLGYIDIERSRGVNDGSIIRIKTPEQHPQNEEKAWQEIASVLEQSAELIRKKGINLSSNELIRWSQLADRAFRLVSNAKSGDG